MPRMQVLSAEEQVQFSTPPVFNSVDRKRYLYFPIDLTKRAQGFRSPTNQIYFLLSCGYFKYCKKFFHPRDYQEKDVVYIRVYLHISKQSLIDFSQSLFLPFELAPYLKCKKITHAL